LSNLDAFLGLNPHRDLLERLVQPLVELIEPTTPLALLPCNLGKFIVEVGHDLFKLVAPVTKHLRFDDQLVKTNPFKATLGTPPRTPRRHAKKRHLGRIDEMATTLGSIWLHTYIHLASRETTRVTYETTSSTTITHVSKHKQHQVAPAKDNTTVHLAGEHGEHMRGGNIGTRLPS
jgi:hypothetical protein